jgi:hypothetical protein
MNTAISTLEIPQGATELTLNELKLICGGGDEDDCRPRPKLRLEKVIVTKIKTKVYKVRRPCDEDDGE